MLSITTKSPYAIRALTELARARRRRAPVPIGELARRRDIPVQFLEQLFAVLRRAGILRSQRGVKGGYSFARDPGDITVLEIVELLDGPLGGGAESIFAEAAAAARAVLAKATINDVVERENRDAGATMYYISSGSGSKHGARPNRRRGVDPASTVGARLRLACRGAVGTARRRRVSSPPLTDHRRRGRGAGRDAYPGSPAGAAGAAIYPGEHPPMVDPLRRGDRRDLLARARPCTRDLILTIDVRPAPCGLEDAVGAICDSVLDEAGEIVQGGRRMELSASLVRDALRERWRPGRGGDSARLTLCQTIAHGAIGRRAGRASSAATGSWRRWAARRPGRATCGCAASSAASAADPARAARARHDARVRIVDGHASAVRR